MDLPMRTFSCITLISAICVGISPYAKAAPLQGSIMAAETSEIPIIPLEKSLLPQHLFVEAKHRADAGATDIQPHVLANTLVRGLLVANRTGEIAYAASLSYKVQNVVRNLRRGEALGKASNLAGVPRRVVARLLKLGTCESAIN
jgi:hypothetical protein